MFCFSTHASVAISSKWSVLCESCSFKQNSDCNFFLNLNMVLEIHLASAMDILLPSPGHCFEARVLTKQKKPSKEGSCRSITHETWATSNHRVWDFISIQP